MPSSSNEYPKVLVVMTAPFNTGGSSRTLDSYFHFWDKKCVAQIYSRNCEPTKGHCSTFYQISDERLAKRWLGHKDDVGKTYIDEDLIESDRLVDEFVGPASKLGYAIGAKHTPMVELLRGLLWRKRLWCTSDFIQWIDNFKPDCVLYNFSNHLFTQEIALFVADRFEIPIIPIIGDDYYFNDKRSISPAYYLFRKKFKHLTERIMAHSVNAIYCSDKCMRKYGGHFELGGSPIYVSSSITRRDFRPIRKKSPLFLYCGSVRLGRNLALVEIADALKAIDPTYSLSVYSSETDEDVCAPLISHPSINFGGRIGYESVVKMIADCDVFVIAEGFRDNDLLFTRYSLSTKAADGLASGAAVLTYGPSDAGVVEYMADTKGSAVCSEKTNLVEVIKRLVEDTQFQYELYENAEIASRNNHSILSSTHSFKHVINDAIHSYKKGSH